MKPEPKIALKKKRRIWERDSFWIGFTKAEKILCKSAQGESSIVRRLSRGLKKCLTRRGRENESSSVRIEVTGSRNWGGKRSLKAFREELKIHSRVTFGGLHDDWWGEG